MAISTRAAGTWAELTASGTVAIPAGATTGDRMFLFAAWKTYSITASVSDWTEITEYADGAVDAANALGSMKVGCWYKDHDGSESDPTLTFFSSPTIAGAVIVAFQKEAGDSWDVPTFTTGNWPLQSTGTVTGADTLAVAAGGLLQGLLGIRDDSATFSRNTTTGISAPGITWAANVVEYPATHLSTTTGFDMASDLVHRIAASGTASGAPTMTASLSASETGAALWVLQSVSTGSPQLVTPTTASLATAVFAPTISLSDNQSVTPGLATLATSTFAPTVTASNHQSVTPTTASLTLGAFAPTVGVSDHQTVTPPVATLALTTFAPTVTVAAAGITVTPGVASLSLATFAPSIAVSDNQTVTPGVVALTVATFAPTVTASDHQMVTVSTATLTLSSSEPTVTATAHQTVVPDVASLVLTTFAPTVTGGAGLTVTPDVAALSLASFAPDVLLTDNQLVTPGAASLALSTFAATVTGSGVVVPPTGGGGFQLRHPRRPRRSRRVTSNLPDRLPPKVPVRVAPRAASLTLTTYSPTVEIVEDETTILLLLGVL